MKNVKPDPQKAIECAIRAVQACGLKVVAVRPDGTIYTELKPEMAPPVIEDVAADLDALSIEERNKEYIQGAHVIAKKARKAREKRPR